jgi:hypothetical protein
MNDEVGASVSVIACIRLCQARRLATSDHWSLPRGCTVYLFSLVYLAKSQQVVADHKILTVPHNDPVAPFMETTIGRVTSLCNADEKRAN